MLSYFFILVIILIGAILVFVLPTMVGFFITNKDLLGNFCLWLDEFSVSALHIHQFSVEMTLLSVMLAGCFVGGLLQLILSSLGIYIVALIALIPLTFTVLIGHGQELGCLILYFLSGLSIVIFLNMFQFFIWNAGVPLEKWLLISYWQLKAIVCLGLIGFLLKFRFSLISEVRFVLTTIFFTFIIFIFWFAYKSYNIIGSPKCHKEPQTVLAFSFIEFLAVVPGIIGLISYSINKVHLDLALGAMLVSIGPLLLFFLIPKVSLLRKLYYRFIKSVHNKYTFVYVLIMAFFLSVPFITWNASVILPSTVMFLIRFFTIMLRYDPLTLDILKDLLCCAYAPWGAYANAAGRTAFGFWAFHKTLPHARDFVDRVAEQSASQSAFNLKVQKNNELYGMGAITKAEWSGNSQRIMSNEIDSVRHSSTKIKNDSFCKESTTRS